MMKCMHETLPVTGLDITTEESKAIKAAVISCRAILFYSFFQKCHRTSQSSIHFGLVKTDVVTTV